MRLVARFVRRPLNALALVLVLAFVGASLLAPWLAPADPSQPGAFKLVGDQNDFKPRPPSANAILGTTSASSISITR